MKVKNQIIVKRVTFLRKMKVNHSMISKKIRNLLDLVI